MNYRSGSLQFQQGFTLVEMMVAMVVGLIVMAGIGQVFIHSKRTSAVQDELSRLQESGRFALHLLQEDILNAGYLGCGQTANFSGNINSTGTYADNFSLPLNGYDASEGGTWVPLIPPELDGVGSTDDVVAGTDVITVRYAQGVGLKMTQPKQSYFFQVTNDSTESSVCPGGVDSYSGLCADDLIIVSDCTKARTFSAESLNPSSGSLSIYHANPAWGDSGDLDPNNHYSPAYSYLFKANTVSYYIHIRDSATGVPSLYRKIGNGEPQELVEGVENMQIRYGVDLDGDNIPNQFQTADGVTDFGQVVNVRIALLLRTIKEKVNRAAATKTFQLLNTDIDTPSDRHIRKVFSTTIQLRNREL